MKKLLAIAFLVLFFSGCLAWPYWGRRDNRDRQDRQRNEQQDRQDQGGGRHGR
jgi:cbb3-type cytochrome oxidase subunit 3